ncbi:uncharacterized protein BDZ99DRAFT_457568 [Mytilinidion resinicola]|uniref:DUF7730 domain-containing protein n=1 Tax=Mytilinidion resinicola TaxID=574789 RepID=A0A6A6ZCT7_9PEZI|nr:uncharacterized protein BDZ99DRAFT_457568 [Mytilinidion resinicola]KAF2818017.1 hypothetical protein BDZ99DRAFT_457568 [Mytilinidion resinicola]
MLIACRQTYFEAISILYSTATFSPELDLLMPSLPRTYMPNVLPEVFNAIKSLKVLHRITEVPPDRNCTSHDWTSRDWISRDWPSAWRTIVSMKGLQHLQVNIMVERYEDFWRRQEVREEWLIREAKIIRVAEAQMLNIKLQSFEIRAPAIDIRDSYGLEASGAERATEIKIGGAVYPIWRVPD